jgi:hypothetical protein
MPNNYHLPMRTPDTILAWTMRHINGLDISSLIAAKPVTYRPVPKLASAPRALSPDLSGKIPYFLRGLKACFF